ncbi:MAG TPA: hypothetical protein VF297_11535 [Pyrinomonadaceae bacterium]
MRFSTALLFLACAFAPTAAQTSAPTAPSQQPQQAQAATPPDLAVVKFSWSKERLNWERDPFGGPVENFDEMRVRARNEKRIDDAKRGGGVDVDRVRREARADAANIEQARAKPPARYGFMYKLTLLNNGARAVKQVEWDYVFTDAATGEELGRHQFGSEEKIAPGKKREFSYFVPSPPTRTVSAHALNSKERVGLAEQVVVVRVLYEDGTEWRLPEAGTRLTH